MRPPWHTNPLRFRDITVSKTNPCWKSSEGRQPQGCILAPEKRRLRIIKPRGAAPFLLTIPPPAYILIGFAAGPARQCGIAGANSRTYDQGPALLSRSLL